MDIVAELKIFRDELGEYGGLRKIMKTKNLEKSVVEHTFDLRNKLLKKASKYRELITDLTKKEKIKVQRKNGTIIEIDLWFTGLQHNFNLTAFDALRYCLDVTTAAIGKLEDEIEKGIRDKETGELIEKQPKPSKKPTEDIGELPIQLFNKMQLHPRIRRASKSLFNSGHYAEAIFAAFKAVNNFTKKKAELSIDGKDLMAKTFNKDKPIIKLNKLSNQSEQDEQEGFRFLFMGAMVGIRNPNAHEDIRQIDPYKALEYLSFASLLMRRVTEGKLETEE